MECQELNGNALFSSFSERIKKRAWGKPTKAQTDRQKNKQTNKYEMIEYMIATIQNVMQNNELDSDNRGHIVKLHV